MKKLMTGNEAVARGVYEAGVHFASAYPGTPSTEILENLTNYDEVHSEWAPNEKVALETAVGACIAGGRSFVSMKHVGLNVAADPFFTFAYMGVNGGCVIVTADEPGQYSSQNEQDNRNYAKAAKVPLFEPSDSQECRDMILEAYQVSEKYNTPVLFRMTTRVCHSKSIVETGKRKPIEVKPYKKDGERYVCVPANARVWRVKLEERLKDLNEYSEKSEMNFWVNSDKSKISVITSGICYKYAREVFGDTASYLKLGFTNPLPLQKIKGFCDKAEVIYVIEENDPYIEEAVRRLGFDCEGKNFFPSYGEMVPDVIRKSLQIRKKKVIHCGEKAAVKRLPTFCAGCPHRGFFYELGKRKNIMITGDIGCYTLAYSNPYQAMDTALCMGASFSLGHGAQTIFSGEQDKTRVIGVLGGSTFFHTGINSLINTVYNGSRTINVILDNRITGMTGHQQNPGTGYKANGEATTPVSIEAIVRAIGIRHIQIIDPNDLEAVNKTLDECLALDEPSVIITRWPCVLKKLSREDKAEFKNVFKTCCAVKKADCIGCRKCVKTGCPALSYSKKTEKVSIDKNACVGCGVCIQVCPKEAIVKEKR